MILLIEPDAQSDFGSELTEMHRLRYHVFKGRLDWAVATVGDQEIDDFDKRKPVYLLQRFGDTTPIQGCVRLLPATGPTMLSEVFGVLTDRDSDWARADVWESSRFAIDTSSLMNDPKGGLARATYELFAGMIEFGLQRELAAIVTATDVRMERILRRAMWPLQRIGDAHMIGSTLAVAGYLEISPKALQRVRRSDFKSVCAGSDG